MAAFHERSPQGSVDLEQVTGTRRVDLEHRETRSIRINSTKLSGGNLEVSNRCASYELGGLELQGQKVRILERVLCGIICG